MFLAKVDGSIAGIPTLCGEYLHLPHYRNFSFVDTNDHAISIMDLRDRC